MAQYHLIYLPQDENDKDTHKTQIHKIASYSSYNVLKWVSEKGILNIRYTKKEHSLTKWLIKGLKVGPRKEPPHKKNQNS